ncbi:MAG: hypothetical protein A2X45_03405 [Lentisphaerae bacterium GWF2_50_93]|nr:MAG: hypothetical protein A2X45_03405 [Lentisphaerae bacterium GWF2_50_93]
MPEISTRCSHCNSVFDVEDSYLGRSVECPDCGKEFIIQPQVQKGQGKPVKNPDNDLLLGLYEIKGEPVAGGMGKVFRVHHTTWNVDLAMKQPHPEFFETEEQKQNFIHECDAWINLGLHPHIVSCYYVREIDGTPNIFAEWMDGGSLSSLISGGKLDSLEKILDIAIQFAWGLDYAHEQGLIHQDVKPDNVLLTSDGTIKVADFGIANAKARFSMTAFMKSQVMGTMISESGAYTPAYCSPEQASRGKLTRRTDIWSWAVSVMEMFTGHAIWPSGSVAGKSFEEYLKSPTDYFKLPMPEALVKLLQECFKENEAERPRDFKIISGRLCAIYQSESGKVYVRVAPIAAADAPDSLNNRALSYMDMGQPEQAKRLWNQALKIDPMHLESTYNQGLYLWHSAQIDDLELVRRLEAVRHGYKNSWRNEYLLATIHLDRGDAESALPLLEDTISRSDNDTAVLKAMEIAVNMRGKGKCIRSFEGHTEYVTSVSFSPNGKFALSGSWDKTLKLWDVVSGECIRTFVGHTGPVSSVSFSPNGKYALSGSSDSTLKLWNIETGECLHTFVGHMHYVNSVSFSPGGKYALSGSNDKTLKLWNLQSGQCLHSFDGHTDPVTSVCFSPDGKYALSGSGNINLKKDNSIKLWGMETGRCLRTFEGHTGSVESVSFSPDGKHALSGSGDGTLKLWNVETGRCLRTFMAFAGDTNHVTSVCFSPDGKFVLSGGYDKNLKLWNMASGQCLRSFVGHTDGVSSVSFSPDGKFLLSAGIIDDKIMKLWDVPVFQKSTDWVLCSIRTTRETLGNEKRFQEAIQEAEKKSVDGDLAAALTALTTACSIPSFERAPQYLELNIKIGQYCRANSIQTGWMEHTFEGHTGSVGSASFSPDGKYALSGSSDSTLKLWNVDTGRCLITFVGHTRSVYSVNFSPDGKYACSGGLDNNVKLWDIKTGQCLRTFIGHTDWVRSVRFSPDGKYALSGSNDKTLKLWNLQSGQCLHTFDGHMDSVISACFSPDGKYALSGSFDITPKLWDIETGECLLTFEGHENSVCSVCFSPDGKSTLSGSKDGTLRLWNVETGQCLRTFMGHTASVVSVCFSPDGKYALSGSSDSTLKLWNVDTGRCLITFVGHTRSVYSVNFSPDGKYALSGGLDNNVKLWRLDWKYEFPGWVVWDGGAEPYLRNFLTVRNGKWNEEDFNCLINDLQNRGYGWLRPEGVRKKLEEMTRKYETH